MVSIGGLTMFNVLVLLVPPPFISSILELEDLPFSGRTTLLFAVILNVVFSMAYERWGSQAVSQMVGYVMNLRGKHRVKDGKTYKIVEGGMR
jgi:cation-transporting P-type ATPase 13A2